jgi:uncharacterized damage-inducible protein DinB
MSIDVNSIENPRVKFFYQMYLPQRRIIKDFYELLPEEQFGYRMVETPERKADTPRESLAHILQVQLIFFNGVKTGKLEFKSMGVEHYWQLPKEQLLAEMDRMEQEMFDYLTDESFDSEAIVQVPWGQMKGVDVLFFLRDHDILHIGWNLAVMDHLNVERYPSLIENWGAGDEDAF